MDLRLIQLGSLAHNAIKTHWVLGILTASKGNLNAKVASTAEKN